MDLSPQRLDLCAVVSHFLIDAAIMTVGYDLLF